MDKRSLVLYLSGLAAAGAVVGLAASCSDQPRIKCTAGHGGFAAVYTPKGAAPACAPPGEVIGIEAYNYPLTDNSNLDPNRGSLGMEPFALADEVAARGPDSNPAHKAYALGDWVSPEPATSDDFCAVKDPNDIEQDLAAIPPTPPGPDGGGADPGSPAISLKYHWTGVRFYNTPRAPGTQLIADLAYTKTEALPDGGTATCTAEFHVVGLWPAVDCTDDADPTKTDVTKCNPEADNSKNRPSGSGISPDLATRCDDALHLCVLAKEPPSWK